MKTIKHFDFKDRMERNPENIFTSKKILDDKTMEELVKESELNWGKAQSTLVTNPKHHLL